jgi:uncharacterized membrane protein (DUF441 family)
MRINPKALASWLRHFKASAFAAAMTPLVIQGFQSLTHDKFSVGFNYSTLFAVLISVAVATITVGGQMLMKSRPEFAPAIAVGEKFALKKIDEVSQSTLGVTPDLSMLNQDVPAS